VKDGEFVVHNRMKQLWLRGPNGAGKSTLGRLLEVAIDKSAYVSSGHLLRERQVDDARMAAGNLAESRVVIDVMKRRYDDLRKRETHVMIIDGFPRKLEEMRMWVQQTRFPDVVVSLKLSDQDVIDRLVNRQICDVCGTSYNSFGNEYLRPIIPAVPGKCDACKNGRLIRRSDDSSQSIKNRLGIFHENEIAIINELGNHNETNLLTYDASKGLPMFNQISQDLKALFS
jgi:adenylate kinase